MENTAFDMAAFVKGAAAIDYVGNKVYFVRYLAPDSFVYRSHVSRANGIAIEVAKKSWSMAPNIDLEISIQRSKHIPQSQCIH